jgi:electron transfer flavoprotein alpha subunit
MLALVPVRDGVLPAGADEVVAECGGRAVLAGSAPDSAELAGIARDVRLVELGPFAPAAWADVLAALIHDDDGDDGIVVLPASPDGRDLAPRLAHRLDRPLLAGAVAVTPTSARLVRGGGLELHDVPIDRPVVATLQPGVRGVIPSEGLRAPEVFVPPSGAGKPPAHGRPRMDAAVVAVLPADTATMDLAEAGRIVAGGAGLDGPERFVQLAAVGARLGAATGATRVVTDRGWVGHERQIGTTGVAVAPQLYLAFGISGAVQHTAGLGDPAHVVSVNTDPYCPMMQMADLAVVSDANAVLDELARGLGD